MRTMRGTLRMSSTTVNRRGERDRADMTVRFAIPTVADGHIFVGARGRLDVYGLLNSGGRSK
jgi:hypothetical protein